jgi:hypothetical protein
VWSRYPNEKGKEKARPETGAEKEIDSGNACMHCFSFEASK